MKDFKSKICGKFFNKIAKFPVKCYEILGKKFAESLR